MSNNKVHEDWQGFYDEFQKETDRGAVIVGAAFLETHLGELILNFLVDDPKVARNFINPKNPTSPLGTLNSRINAAYCLGLIGPNMYNELNTIRQIRNLFAHGLHSISFEDKKIEDLIKQLKYSEILPETFSKSARNIFTVSLSILANHVALRALRAKREQLKIGKDFKVEKLTANTR